MYLVGVVLPVFIYFHQVTAFPEIVKQDTSPFLSLQSAPFSASPTTFDWWPFDDFWDSSTSQPPSATGSSFQSPAATAFLAPSPPLAQTSPSPSPSVIDITALPPAATDAAHPRARTRENLKPFSLAPVFVIAGLSLGALVGWSAFSSYERWVAKDPVVILVPGPAYAPVSHRTDAERGKPAENVHGSPSKHTRHGTPYSSYSVGKGFLGRIPSARFRKSPTLIPQEMKNATGSEKTYAWPSLPGSSDPTPSQSRSTTRDSTKLARTASAIPDDPFSSVGTDATPPTMVAATRTSTRSTFAHASRFGEMLDCGEDENSVVVSPISPTIPAEGEGEAKTGLFKKIRFKSKSVRRKKEGGEDAVNELASAAKTSPRKSSWTWIPSISPDPYTDIPVRASSPRPRTFRTPEPSPRKFSYVRSSEGVRMVDTSVLPASPPTLMSPRLDSEFFLRGTIFDTSGARTPEPTRSPRAVAGFRKFDIDSPDAKSPSVPRPGESECLDEDRTPTNLLSRPGPGRDPSVTSISKFPGDPPPKRTPAERFYARRSALGKVEEIIQRSKSQTSVADVLTRPGRQELGTVGEGRQFGRIGKEFESGGIEQRLFES